MVSYTEFRRFYEIGWKIKSLIMVMNQLKLEISRIWSGIPYISRKKIGIEKVNKIFDTVNKSIRSSINELYTLSGQYNKIYRNIVVTLQNLGVFVNKNFSEDLLKMRVDEANVTTEVVEQLLENISHALNIPKNLDKGIDDPNIIDLFMINKVRVDIVMTIIKEVKKMFNEILNTTNDVNDRADKEIVEKIRSSVEKTNKSFDDIINEIPQLHGLFDAVIDNVIGTLKSAFIEVSVESNRKELITEVIGYSDLSDIYRILRGSLKHDNSFAKLLENRADMKDSFSEVVVNTQK